MFLDVTLSAERARAFKSAVPRESFTMSILNVVGRMLTAAALVAALSATATSALAQSRQLAPGFTALPKDARVVIAPLDVELFSISAGGVLEPKADWTESALQHMKGALQEKAKTLGLAAQAELSEAKADELAELLQLHAAVARSIAIHHTGILKLPTKEDRLEWTFGDTLRPLQQATGARYAVFTWVRDSYASAERKAMMVGMALLGIGIGGGAQIGYATLVDLETGQVLWFNQLARASGDLRDGKAAAESVNALLTGFPAVQ
jgi:hypothetical protein